MWTRVHCIYFLQYQISRITPGRRCLIFNILKCFFSCIQETNHVRFIAVLPKPHICSIAFPHGKKSNAYAGLRHRIWHGCHYLTSRLIATDPNGYNIDYSVVFKYVISWILVIAYVFVNALTYQRGLAGTL